MNHIRQIKSRSECASPLSACSSISLEPETAHKSVRVHAAEEKLITEAHLLNQVQRLCRAIDAELANTKYERSISASQFEGVQKRVEKLFGFSLGKGESRVPGGGQGVFVKSGTVPKNHLVAFYPGTIYRPGDTVLIQSLANAFVLRCADGLLVDANSRGLSKLVYTSCSFRDRVGPTMTSDQTWMTPYPANPLALGHIVNNHGEGTEGEEVQANVCYQEADLPLGHFIPQLRRYIPNNYYNSTLGNSNEDSVLRLVLLVSLREIQEGEELFSSYFTLIT